MAIIYVHTFHAIGNSSDIKPVDSVPEGMAFWELDTQKVYLFTQGEWQEIKAGTGIWSPSTAEALTNKTIVLDSNIISTTSGNLGFFAFNSSGQFVFVPIGSANQYMKVNSQGTGFEFGDPAVSGSWDPDSTETLTHKTLDVLLNHIKQTTPAAGAILLDNGTDFIPLTKGSIGQALKVKQDGTVGWDTDQVGEGGQGSTLTSFLPHVVNRKEGWYDGGISSNYAKANGILDGTLTISGTHTKGIYDDNVRGRHVRISLTTSNDDVRFRTPLMFRREYDTYLMLKLRYSVNANGDFYFGVHSDSNDTFSDPSHMNSKDNFLIGRRGTDDNNWMIFHNSGTSNYSEDDSSVPFTTNPFTLELQSVAASNKFQWRIDDVGGTWNDISTNIPRTNTALCLVLNENSATETDHNLEVYLIEASNKVMF